jgi:hypothetical protein
MELSLVIQIWMAAIFTILIYSIAFRDNNLFKFAEYTFVGAAAGHSLVYGVDNLKRYGWDNLMGGAYLYIVVFLLGILLYSRYHPEYFWVSRYPLAIMMGLGIGLSMRAVVTAEFIAQIKSTAAIPLFGVTDPMKLVSNIIFIVLVLSTLYFFVFTFPKAHEGGLGVIPQIARYGMMAAFAYSFSNTVLSRYNMIFGRLNFIYTEWIPLPGAIIALPIVLILLIYAMLPPEKRPWPKKE